MDPKGRSNLLRATLCVNIGAGRGLPEHEPPPMNPLMREGIGKGEDGRGVAGVRDSTGEGGGG